MQADNKHQGNLQLVQGPDKMTEAKSLEQKMGFNYRQAIGELIYTYPLTPEPLWKSGATSVLFRAYQCARYGRPLSSDDWFPLFCYRDDNIIRGGIC